MSRSSAPPLLEVRDLGFRFDRRTVLDVEALTIERGRVILVSGDNGSGKTTLLKLLAGLLTAQRGHFCCLGVPMRPRAAARFCRGRHVYLHQTPYLFDTTVAANVAYGLRLRGRDAAQRRVEIRDALAWAGLEHLSRRHASQLSSGEQQRVALTRARILGPSLLLLDEITANMDADSRRRTHAMVDDLRAAGTSVVFATHDLEPLTALCDAHLVLEDGRLSVARSAAANIVPLRGERGPGAA